VGVFEYQPENWVSEYLGLSAHAILPTKLHDIRPVETTPADPKAVLAIIERAKSSQNQDRPDNHIIKGNPSK
jgi:hypothetical protein